MKKRVLALALTTALLLGLFPAAAAPPAAPFVDGTIVAIEAPGGITAPVGTAIEDLALPTELTATRQRVTTQEQRDENGVPLQNDDGTPMVSTTVTTEETTLAGVDWSCPDYDPDQAETYSFTAQVTGYVLGAGVALPRVNVKLTNPVNDVPAPSMAPSAEPTPTPESPVVPTAEPTPTPSESTPPTESPAPTAEPSAAPEPSVTPTAEPTPTPTVTPVPSPSPELTNSVNSFAALETTAYSLPVGQYVDGAALAAALLPSALGATVDDGEISLPILWHCPDFDGEGAGTYSFTASAEGYALAEGVAWPTVTVTLVSQRNTANTLATAAASVRGVDYATLGAALKEAQTGDTITVLRDYQMPSVGNGLTSEFDLKDTREIFLDLNGYTLTGVSGQPILVVSGGGSLTIVATKSQAGYLKGGSTSIYVPNGNLTINGDIVCYGMSVFSVNAYPSANGKSNVTVNSGRFTSGGNNYHIFAFSGGGAFLLRGGYYTKTPLGNGVSAMAAGYMWDTTILGANYTDGTSGNTYTVGVVPNSGLVWSGGSDVTGRGTRANPYKTVGYAIGQVASGGTVYLMSNIVEPANAITCNKNITITTDPAMRINNNLNRAAIWIDMSSQKSWLNVSGGGTLTLRNVGLTQMKTTVGTESPIVVDGGQLVTEFARISNFQTASAALRTTANAASRITLRGGTEIKSNTSTDASSSGGAHLQGGVMTMEHGSMISGNTSTGAGGGVAMRSSQGETPRLIMYGGAIQDNTSERFVGGVFIDGGTFDMADGSIARNGSGTGALAGGGGVMVSNGTFNMTGGSITNNNSQGTKLSGGGVVLNNSTFTMGGGAGDPLIANNTTTLGGGGVSLRPGISASSTFTMKSGTISGNTALSGGGVSVGSGTTFRLEGGTISGNTATNNGGGVYLGADAGTVTMTGGTIENNKVMSSSDPNHGGGGVSVLGGSFTMSGGTIAKNTTNHHGGGVHISGTGRFTLSDTAKIVENTAPSNGGGVYVYSGTLAMNGGSITGNTAANGGVFVYLGTLDMSGGTISGNKATWSGGMAAGGVYAASVDTVKLSGSAAITGNTQNSTARNLLLASGVSIALSGSLTGGAQVGVSQVGAAADMVFATATNKAIADNSVGAFHDDGGTLTSVTDGATSLKWSTDIVASVTPLQGGLRNYSKLQYAVNTAKTGETVTLLKDTTETVEVKSTTSFAALDWNGKTLTAVPGPSDTLILYGQIGIMRNTVNGTQNYAVGGISGYFRIDYYGKLGEIAGGRYQIAAAYTGWDSYALGVVGYLDKISGGWFTGRTGGSAVQFAQHKVRTVFTGGVFDQGTNGTITSGGSVEKGIAIQGGYFGSKPSIPYTGTIPDIAVVLTDEYKTATGVTSTKSYLSVDAVAVAEARVSTDSGATWTYYGALTAAMAAAEAAGSAIVETMRNVTLNAPLTVSKGDITLRSLSSEGEGVMPPATPFRITRSTSIMGEQLLRIYSATDTPSLTLSSIVVDGNSSVASPVTNGTNLVGVGSVVMDGKVSTGNGKLILGEGSLLTGNWSSVNVSGSGTVIVQDEGSLVMRDGAEISGNASLYGSAVTVYNGTTGSFAMEGGTIRNNYTYGRTGDDPTSGAIHMGRSTKFIMTGGTITENHAAAGGVAGVDSYGKASVTIQISGGATIDGNFSGATVDGTTGTITKGATASNLYLKGNLLSMTGNLTGKVRLNSNGKNTVGVQFGTPSPATASYTGADRFVNDVDPTLAGLLSTGGKLVWGKISDGAVKPLYSYAEGSSVTAAFQVSMATAPTGTPSVQVMGANGMAQGNAKLEGAYHGGNYVVKVTGLTAGASYEVRATVGGQTTGLPLQWNAPAATYGSHNSTANLGGYWSSNAVATKEDTSGNTVVVSGIAYSVKSGTMVDIQGYDQVRTTFANAGWLVRSNSPAIQIWAVPTIVAGTSGADYVQLTYHFRNNSDTALTGVNLGAASDIMIGRNDRAPVYMEPYGIRTAVSDAEDALSFAIITQHGDGVAQYASNVSGRWFGHYGQRIANLYANLVDPAPLTRVDSGAAFSWQGITLQPGEVGSRSVVIGVAGKDDQDEDIGPTVDPGPTGPGVVSPEPTTEKLPTPSTTATDNSVSVTTVAGQTYYLRLTPDGESIMTHEATANGPHTFEGLAPQTTYYVYTKLTDQAADENPYYIESDNATPKTEVTAPGAKRGGFVLNTPAPLEHTFLTAPEYQFPNAEATFYKPDGTADETGSFQNLSVMVDTGSFTLGALPAGYTSVTGVTDAGGYVTSASAGGKYTYLIFAGNFAKAQAEDFLRSITFTVAGQDIPQRVDVDADVIDLPGGVARLGSSYYRYVPHRAIHWNTAYAAAKASSFNGLPGYLITVEGAVEHNFVYQRYGSVNGWMGGVRTLNTSGFDGASFDASAIPLNGAQWKWVTGPSAGTAFWDSPNHSAPIPGVYANWNRNPGPEPNNAGYEWAAQYGYGGAGKWNDYKPGNSYIGGYFVEYTAYGTYQAANPMAHDDQTNLFPTELPDVAEILTKGVADKITEGEDAGQIKHYKTLAAAVADYHSSDNQVIQMIADTTEDPVTIEKDVYLDLNGRKVNADITVGTGFTLYGLDSATNGYQAKSKHGAITGAVAGAVGDLTRTTKDHFPARAMQYLPVKDTEGLSFHRFNVQVAKYSFVLDTVKNTATLRFFPAYQGDDKATASLERIGGGARLTDGTQEYTVSWKARPGTLLSAKDLYYYPVHLANLTNSEQANGFTTNFDLIGCLEFGDGITFSSEARVRSFLQILKLFYRTASAEDTTAIDDFVTENNLMTEWEELP